MKDSQAMVLLLLLAVVPLDDSLVGPPPLQPSLSTPRALPPIEPRVSRDWYARLAPFRSPVLPSTARSSEPHGGVVCELEASSPAWYLDLARVPRSPNVLGGVSVFAPINPDSPEHSLSLDVMFNNASGKHPVSEFLTGLATLGFSTFRLIPRHVARLEVDFGALPFSKHGAYGDLRCRWVNRADLEALAAQELDALGQCATDACLRAAASVVGPWHPRVAAQQLRIRDAALLKRNEWRRKVGPRSLTGLRVLDAAVRGSTVELLVRNASSVAMPMVRLNELVADAIDDAGQGLTLRLHARPGWLAPGAQTTFEFTIQEQLEGTLTLRLRALWGHFVPLPGTFFAGGQLVTTEAPTCSTGPFGKQLTFGTQSGSASNFAGLVMKDGTVVRSLGPDNAFLVERCEVPVLLELEPHGEPLYLELAEHR